MASAGMDTPTARTSRAERRRRTSVRQFASPVAPLPANALAEALDRIDEAIAIVTSAWLAFEMRQSENGALRLAEPLDTDPLRCLRHGCQHLRMAFSALDDALTTVSGGQL